MDQLVEAKKVDQLADAKNLVDRKREEEWDQIDIMIEAHLNVEEAINNNLGTNQIQAAIDNHTWQLTRSYQMGHEVNDVEKQAMKIKDKTERESCAAAAAACDVHRLSSSSVFELKCWFYQTDGTVIIQIPIKGLKQEQVQVETADKKVIVRIKISSSCNNNLIQFDLVRQINPLSSSYGITDSHVIYI
ncbi:unnamed protein product [Rotaria sp. Silwood2]|nr:unnamed protein product [Rotaria sp. Silwood2]